ncbi:MAG: hypothetical protein ACTSPI_12605 [Candidatus Heimdallarchaeaceae archaeon]
MPDSSPSLAISSTFKGEAATELTAIKEWFSDNIVPDPNTTLILKFCICKTYDYLKRIN